MRTALLLAVVLMGSAAGADVEKLEAVLVKAVAFRDALAAGLASGADPVSVVFPSGASRLVSRDVLPGYVAVMTDRIRKLTEKCVRLRSGQAP